MNAALQKTIFHLTGKPNLSLVQKNELEALINAYPYFAPLHVAYAAKLNTIDTHQGNLQLQKTGLYCTNQKWLQYQLMDATNFVVEKVNQQLVPNIAIPTIEEVKDIMNGVETASVNNIKPIEVESTVAPEITEQPITLAKGDPVIDVQETTIQSPIDLSQLSSLVAEMVESRISSYSLEKPAIIEKVIDEIVPEQEPIIELEKSKPIELSIELAPNFVKPENNEVIAEAIATEVVVPPTAIIEPIKIEDFAPINNVEPTVIEAAITKELTIVDQAATNTDYPIATAIEPKIQAEVEKEDFTNYSKEEEIIREEPKIVLEADEKLEEIKTTEPISDANSKEEVLTEEENDFQLPTLDIHAQIAKLKEDWHKPLPEEKLTFSFENEPYYTIDYFASQGIKFDLTQEPKDLLTTKMLRFTDWLRKMNNNKVEQTNEDDEDGQDIEKAIVSIANVSNQPKEVVTETMAQVFEKQGKINKAIQLYIKLSFLNPNKTAYFATKIQELKGIKS